ncbi:MAG TPA: hypothetical protein VMV29_20500 [Ktedonobacterales bacterium]|nr:hypothetical protein [Ktedonobacterales bacterium]
MGPQGVQAPTEQERQTENRQPHRRRRQRGRSRASSIVVGLTLLVVVALTLVGCSLSGGSGSTTTTGPLGLSQLSWCDGPQIIFQDDSSSTQSVISDWSKVQGQLGFTYYLPATLPQGSCLDLAGGVIHDQIFGGKLDLTYTLPKIGSLTFAEAPKHGDIVTSLQCAVSPADSAANICIGAISNTTITIAGRDSTSNLQSIFNSLKANVTWLPANSPTVTPTATSAA